MPSTLNNFKWLESSLFSCVIILSLLLPPAGAPMTCFAAEEAYLVNYGANASTIEGDDDFFHILFIRVPAARKTPVYVRIFDPDCGDDLDANFSVIWNTLTRFRLFGGENAFSRGGSTGPSPGPSVRTSGTLLADRRFGRDKALNMTWFTLAEVSPESGEPVGQHRYFKLLIEGVKGLDGNRYLVIAADKPEDTVTADNVAIFTYSATINLSAEKRFAELRFLAPGGTERVTVHNFDASGAYVGLNTAFRSGLEIPTSGQNQWRKGTIRLEDWETGRFCAVRFQGGREMPNDATFYVTDKSGNALPIFLPIYIRKDNLCPEVRFDVQYVDNCKALQFDASGTSDPEGDELSYMWLFGDGNRDSGIRARHDYKKPGKYTAVLVVENESGLVYNSVRKEIPVLINHPPIADAGKDRIAAPGQKLTFDASGSKDPDGRITAYSWNFGDGERAEGKTVRHVYQNPGRYSVRLKVTDNSNRDCSNDIDQAGVFVNSAPIVDIGGDKIASVNENIIFDGEFKDTDGTIQSYVWDLGDGRQKTGQEIVHRYEKPGRYTVRVTVEDDSGAQNSKASDSLEVTVNDPPISSAGPDRHVSINETVIFDGSESHDKDGRLIEFHWDFGDGAQARIRRPDRDDETAESRRATHAYKEAGRYKVRLTVKDDSGSSSNTDEDQATVIVNAPPKADAGGDIHVNEGRVRFDGTGSDDPDGNIIEYRWDFGDGSTGKGPEPVHVYRNPGVYDVRLTVRDDSKTNSDTASDQIKATINHPPISDAGPDITSVPGRTLEFNGSGAIDPDGEIVSWTWDFGDGSTGNGVIAAHAFEKPGIYAVLLTVVDNSISGGVSAYDAARVHINAPPVASPGPDRLIAPGTRVKFDGSSSYDPDGRIDSWNWRIFDETGTPAASFDTPEAEYEFKAPGVYKVVLTITDAARVENSTVQKRISVRVNHPPAADAGEDILTSGKTVSLNGEASSDPDGDPLEYRWDFGDGTPSGKGPLILHEYETPGVYPVVLTVNDGTGLENAVSSSSITVRINSPPEANAGEDIDICAGKVVLFDGGASKDPDAGLLSYNWDFGDGTGAVTVNPTKVYKKGGIYPVTLTVQDNSGLENGNSDTDKIVVKVSESPVANAGPDQTVCAGAPVHFDGTESKDVDGVVDRYFWDFGDGDVGGGPNPVHIYENAGEYRVTLTITGTVTGNCSNSDTDEMLATVHEAPVIQIIGPDRAAPGVQVLFSGTTETEGKSTDIEWEWDFGDGSRATGKEASHTFQKPGNYLITLTGESQSDTDCNRSQTQTQIQVNAQPAANIRIIDAKADPRADTPNSRWAAPVNHAVHFDGSLSSDNDGAVMQYRWDFGDGGVGEGVSPIHIYQTPGIYPVTLTVIDNTLVENNSAVASASVRINGRPNPVIRLEREATGEKTVLSPNETVVGTPDDIWLFSAEESEDPDGSPLHFKWIFDRNKTPVEEVEVRRRFVRPGIHTVSLRADDGEGLDNSIGETSAAIWIGAPPEISIAPMPAVLPPNARIPFIAEIRHGLNIQDLKFQWDFGDGETGDGKIVSHRFQNPGKYIVRLNVSYLLETARFVSESSIPITINSAPIARIDGDTVGFCGGANDFFHFDASGSTDADHDPLTYSWDFGDGATAEGLKVVHAYKKPGVYQVKLTVDDGNGLKSSIASDIVAVEVNLRK